MLFLHFAVNSAQIRKTFHMSESTSFGVSLEEFFPEKIGDIFFSELDTVKLLECFVTC